MSKEHTPLPWKVNLESNSIEYYGNEKLAHHLDGGRLYEIADVAGYYTTENEDFANAAFIVKACNNHYQLVELLNECVLQIEYLHNKFKETGSGNAVVSKSRELLKSLNQ